MKANTREWIEKAEADFISAGREYRARKHPNYDGACFFAQQCVEKYLKARLIEEGTEVRERSKREKSGVLVPFACLEPFCGYPSGWLSQCPAAAGFVPFVP